MGVYIISYKMLHEESD